MSDSDIALTIIGALFGAFLGSIISPLVNTIPNFLKNRKQIEILPLIIKFLLAANALWVIAEFLRLILPEFIKKDEKSMILCVFVICFLLIISSIILTATYILTEKKMYNIGRTINTHLILYLMLGNGLWVIADSFEAATRVFPILKTGFFPILRGLLLFSSIIVFVMGISKGKKSLSES